MSEAAPAPSHGLTHYDGPAVVKRYALYVQSALTLKEPLREAVDGVSWLFTPDAEEALREGLPTADQRPLATFTGVEARWSPEKTLERLRKAMRLGSALCIRIEREVDPVALAYFWRGDAGIAFPRSADRLLKQFSDVETQSLVAVPLALPAGATPLFSLVDRETQIRLPGEARPLRVDAFGGEVKVAQSYRPDLFNRKAFTGVASPTTAPLPDLDLLRVALDRSVPAMEGFVAAWAALERLAKGNAASLVPALRAADRSSLSPAMRDVLGRLDQPRGLDSVVTAYLLVRWSLGGEGMEEAKTTFQALNAQRQRVYHSGDAASVASARNSAIALLLELLKLQQGVSGKGG